jgi:IPT/TIG domain
MKSVAPLSVLFVCLLCLVLMSCGGSSSTPAPNPQNPAPVVQSLSPSSAAAGSGGFTLTVTGSGFLASSTISWNGTGQTTAFVSATQLTTTIPASSLSASGTATVGVTNPAPGGGQSSANFTISAPPAPAVTAISPTSIVMGGPGFTLTVAGTNFVQGSVVEWNGSARPTTYVNNTKLTATIAASDITASGSVPVSVTTASPGGGTSSAVAMTVNYPLPAVASLSPSSVVMGGGSFTLTVNGSNFVSGAVVNWNSIARVTQFVSSTQLKATILASDIATASVVPLTVQNPSPSAGLSNISSFTVANVVPHIASVTPTTAVAGTTITIDVTGTGFLSTSKVQLGGQGLVTTYVSGTHVQADVASAHVGQLPVTVFNPAPGGGSSNSISFDSTAAGPPTSSVVASIDPSGNDVDAGQAAMSTTARYVTFGNYVRDTCFGIASACTPSTLQFTTNPESAFGVSDDGRYVSTQLGTSGNADVKFWDTCFGASSCTISSVSPSGLQIVPSGGTWLSKTGRYLAYSTGAFADASLPISIFDTCVGAPLGCTQTSYATGQSTPGGFFSTTSNALAATPDARYLVFADTNQQIVLHDSCFGAAPGCTPSNTVMSAIGITCEHPSISADAQYIAYSCRVPGMHILVQNTCIGASGSCTSVRTQIPDPGTNSNAPLISGNGRYVAFNDYFADISSTQTLFTPTVYVFDTCLGGGAGCTAQSKPVCLAADGAIANSICTLDGITDDGRHLLISSSATNIATVPSGVTNLAYIVPNPLP